MNQIKFRPLAYPDFAEWLPLWDANNLGQRDDAVTQETWRRILAEDEPVYGICAEQNGSLLGIAHYILHPTTGHLKPVCYLQDVFVLPEQRGRGRAGKGGIVEGSEKVRPPVGGHASDERATGSIGREHRST